MRNLIGLVFGGLVMLVWVVLSRIAPTTAKRLEFRAVYWQSMYAMHEDELKEWEAVATPKDRIRIAGERKRNEEKAKRRAALAASLAN